MQLLSRKQSRLLPPRIQLKQRMLRRSRSFLLPTPRDPRRRLLSSRRNLQKQALSNQSWSRQNLSSTLDLNESPMASKQRFPRLRHLRKSSQSLLKQNRRMINRNSVNQSRQNRSPSSHNR